MGNKCSKPSDRDSGEVNKRLDLNERPPPVSLLDLPEHIYDEIIKHLNERDRKSLSLVCFKFLQCCEKTFERAPRIWIPISSSLATGGDRIIIEPEFLETTKHSNERWARPLQDDRLMPPAYTSQEESSRPVHFRMQRQQAEQETRMWLCPHVGCTFENFATLPEVQPSSIQDTRLSACAFPKCALWARHATVPASTLIGMRELCSIFQVYRRQCCHTHPEDLRRVLLTITQDQLKKAMSYLHMPICRHLTLGSTAFTAPCDPRQMPIIPERQDINWRDAAAYCFDVGSCEACRSEGTYTTWGFFARLCRSTASHHGIAWLDIELALTRPYTNRQGYGSKDHTKCKHWMGHSIPAAAMSTFVDGWWKWAQEVVVEGFDWRARLPSGFLAVNRSACINFPEGLPTYDEHDFNVALIMDEQPIPVRPELTADDPLHCWQWRDYAGINSIGRCPPYQYLINLSDYVES